MQQFETEIKVKMNVGKPTDVYLTFVVDKACDLKLVPTCSCTTLPENTKLTKGVNPIKVTFKPFLKTVSKTVKYEVAGITGTIKVTLDAEMEQIK